MTPQISSRDPTFPISQVTIEMFNALNALSEDGSLLQARALHWPSYINHACR